MCFKFCKIDSQSSKTGLDKSGTTEIVEGESEGKRAAWATKEGEDMGAPRGGRKKIGLRQPRPPLPIHKPERRGEGAGHTHSWSHRAVRRRRDTCQVIPQPWRTSDSRRYMGNGCTQTQTITSTGALRMTGYGRGGGITSRSCPHTAMTRRVGRSGISSSGP